jgi:hypothetical protein
MRKNLLRQIRVPLIGPFCGCIKLDRLHSTDTSRVTDIIPNNCLIIAHDQFTFLKYLDGLEYYAFDKEIILYN